MRHVAAFLLAAMGSSQPNANTIKAILGSVGVEADDKQLDILLQKMAGKNVEQVLAAGKFFRSKATTVYSAYQSSRSDLSKELIRK